MGIKFKCKECGKEVKFPDTPNFDTDRHEQLAHAIYTHWANRGLCGRCMEDK